MSILARHPKLKRNIARAIILLEFFLAAAVIAGTAWYLFLSLETLILESGEVTFFFTFIEILLSAIIGIEVARVLITHNLVGLAEVFGLVLARKALAPEATSLDILIIIIAFAALVYIRKEVQEQGCVSDGLDEYTEEV